MATTDKDDWEKIKDLMSIEVPDELKKEVRDNKSLYPRIHRFNTLEKVKKRQEKLGELMKKTKDTKLKQKRKNEYIALMGKDMALSMKKFGPIGNLFAVRTEIQEIDVMHGMKKSEEDKIAWENQKADNTAMYYQIGTKMRTFNKK